MISSYENRRKAFLNFTIFPAVQFNSLPSHSLYIFQTSDGINAISLTADRFLCDYEINRKL